MCSSIYQFEASSRSHLHVGGQLRKIPDPDKIFTQLECGGVSQVESHGRFPPNIKDKNMGSIKGDLAHRCFNPKDKPQISVKDFWFSGDGESYWNEVLNKFGTINITLRVTWFDFLQNPSL